MPWFTRLLLFPRANERSVPDRRRLHARRASVRQAAPPRRLRQKCGARFVRALHHYGAGSSLIVKPTAKADLPGSPGTVLFTILTPTSAGVPWAAFAAFKTAAAFLLTVSIQDTSSFDTKSSEPRLAADAADLVDTSRMYRS